MVRRAPEVLDAFEVLLGVEQRHSDAFWGLSDQGVQVGSLQVRTGEDSQVSTALHTGVDALLGRS